MPTERPAQIKAHHLARKGVAYARQSCGEQVRSNTGSTEYQRGQIRHALAWGWPLDRTEVNDCDLGLSGAAPDHRPGYRRLLEEIERGEIGAIFLADMMRGGRNAAEWLRLLERCRVHQVLVVIDGKIYDLDDNAGRLFAQLMATFAEYDNDVRRETMMHGRLAKLEKGQAVCAPPTGYLRLPNGSWQKDPDPAVQAGIAAVFRTFVTQRSCQTTVKALKAAGVKLPSRRHGQLLWVQPQLSRVYRILTHPAYKGDCPYGRRQSDPRAGRDRNGRFRLRVVSPDRVFTIKNHHEPYVSTADWDEIQSILKLNGPSETRRNLGPGSALCQGFISCGIHHQHQWAMVTVYKAERRDGGRSHAYYCQGEYRFGDEQCGHIPGDAVDQAVFTAVIERLSTPRLEVLREAAGRAALGERSELQRRRLELNRAEQQMILLEGRFLSLDPTSVEIAKSLEERLEVAKREVKRLRRLVAEEPGPVVSFDDASFEELIGLCQDLRALWDAPTTTVQHRKQLLRMIIDKVILEYRDAERLRLRIVWADGGDAIVEVTLGGYANRLIEEMAAADLSPEAIAARLNELGVRTLRGRTWTRHTIAHKLRRNSRRDGGKNTPK